MKRKSLVSVLLIVFVGLLAACAGSGEQPVVVVEGAAETAAAATAFYEGQTATAAAPTATVAPTVTPYVRPTDDPEIAPDTVIASVAGHDITVEEFRNRVRFERWFALDTLRTNIDTAGLVAEDITDPQNPMTPTVIGILYTLSDPEAFAENVLTQMLRERVMHREYLDRNLQANTALYNNLWLTLLDMEPTGDGGLPENFADAVDAYIAHLAPYTAITEVDLRFKLTVRSEQQTLLDVIGSGADYDPRSLDIRHILVSTEEEAQEIMDLLADGADFAELARDRSLDESAQGTGGELGFFERGVMLPEFEELAFDTEPGEIVGPLPTSFGYHVVQPLAREYAYRVSRIVVATEAEAQDVMARLDAGEDFADLVDEVSLLPEDGGDLGLFTPDSVPPDWKDLIFSAAVGDVVGPVQSGDGYNVLTITDREVYRVNARHILVETEQEALDVLDRLEAGEDFADLAQELSLDTGAQGNDGALGFLTSDQMPEALSDALRTANPGDLVGPVETEGGFEIVEVLDSRVDMLSPSQLDELKAVHFQNWLREEIRAIEIDEVWRQAYPADPLPADISPVLAEFESSMAEALAAMGIE